MDKKEFIQRKIKNIEKLINDLQNELKELKEEKKLDREENKIWKPEKNDEYFIVNFHGNTEKVTWFEDNYDKSAYEIGNCFKTKKEAEDMAFCVRLYGKLMKFAKENNRWEEGQNIYFAIYYDGKEDKLSVMNGDKNINIFSVIKFSSRQVCEKAIETFENELHEYFQIKILNRITNN